VTHHNFLSPAVDTGVLRARELDDVAVAR